MKLIAQAEVRGAGCAPELLTNEGCFIAELSNIASDEEVSIARARVPTGRTTRWHRLHGIRERYVILTGVGQVELDAELIQTVGPGDVVLIPDGCPQRISALGGADLSFLAICSPRFKWEAYEDAGDLDVPAPAKRRSKL